MRTPLRTGGTLAATVVLALAGLTACSGDSVSERLTEKAIENAGGEGVDVDLDSDSGEFRIDTDEGSFSAGNELPEGFPDDIPLLEDGEIISAIAADDATGSGEQGYVVAMQTDLSDTDALTEATSLLEGAGFVQDAAGTGEVGVFGAALFNREPFQVLLSAVGADGASTTVQYYIGPIPE